MFIAFKLKKSWSQCSLFINESFHFFSIPLLFLPSNFFLVNEIPALRMLRRTIYTYVFTIIA